MTDTREAADPFRELAKRNYAYVMVRMNKSEVREFFDGFLAHVPWVRAVSIDGQEGITLQLATPWNQLPKGTKVTVKMPRKKFGAFLLDVLRLRAPWAKVGDAVTLVAMACLKLGIMYDVHLYIGRSTLIFAEERTKWNFLVVGQKFERW